MAHLISGTIRNDTISETDSALARSSSSMMAHLDISDAPMITRIENKQTGQNIETTIPSAAMRILADVLARMADGQSVTVIPLHSELSTQQAADILNVSRPYFIKLLEEGKMPFRKVGEQRRVRYQDLLSYMEVYQHAASAALEEMTSDAQRIGLY